MALVDDNVNREGNEHRCRCECDACDCSPNHCTTFSISWTDRHTNRVQNYEIPREMVSVDCVPRRHSPEHKYPRLASPAPTDEEIVCERNCRKEKAIATNFLGVVNVKCIECNQRRRCNSRDRPKVPAPASQPPNTPRIPPRTPSDLSANSSSPQKPRQIWSVAM